MYAYTNINFTDKQKEDAPKLYDLIVGNDLFAEIVDNIPADEYRNVMEGIFESVNAIYTYRNSVMGILDILKEDYSALDFDATEIQQKLGDPENMQLLRDILTKLG